jgi:hypothetical protein
MGKLIKKKNNSNSKSLLDKIIGNRDVGIRTKSKGDESSIEIFIGKINIFKK